MRTWFVIVTIALVTVVYSIAVMLHMWLFRDRSVFFFYARSWSRILLKLAGVRVHTVGVEHLVQTQRYVYAANHASLFDIPVMLVGIPDNIRIMYKRELQKIPVFGWCLKMSPYIAVDRERSREASDVLEGVVDTMSTGSSVLVFPEGTRSPDGSLGPFRRGVVAIAVRSGTPVVPVALIGTAAILPARTNRLSGGDVRLVIHAPLSVGGERTPQEEKALVGRLRSIIQETITLQP